MLKIQEIVRDEILPLGGDLYWVRSITQGFYLERVGFSGPPDEQPCPVRIQKPGLLAVSTNSPFWPQFTDFGYPQQHEYYSKPTSGRYWAAFSHLTITQTRPIPDIVVHEILPAGDDETPPRVKLTVYDLGAGRRDYPPTYAQGDVAPIGTKGGGLKITRIQPAIPNLWVWGQSEKGEPRKFQGNLRGWVEFEVIEAKTNPQE